MDILKDKALERSLLFILMAQVVSEGSIEPATVENIASLSPRLPPSLTLRYLLKAAKGAEPGVSKRALSSARAMLQSRKMLERGEAQNLAELEAILNKNFAFFQLDDARIALSLFDSDLDVIRAATKNVLDTILSQLPGT
jgi:hypothetical protein